MSRESMIVRLVGEASEPLHAATSVNTAMRDERTAEPRERRGKRGCDAMVRSGTFRGPAVDRSA